jgi:hypothetical protein
VAVGGDPYLVHSGLPTSGRGSTGRPPAGSSRCATSGWRCCSTTTGLSAYDAEGLAWESDRLGPDAVWLGRLDDEVHLRAGELLHRVQLRHGRTVTEAASW